MGKIVAYKFQLVIFFITCLVLWYSPVLARDVSVDILDEAPYNENGDFDFTDDDVGGFSCKYSKVSIWVECKFNTPEGTISEFYSGIEGTELHGVPKSVNPWVDYDVRYGPIYVASACYSYNNSSATCGPWGDVTDRPRLNGIPMCKVVSQPECEGQPLPSP